MATNSRKGRPLKAATEKVSHRIMVNLNRDDYARLMQSYDPAVYPSKAAYYRARMVDQSIQVRQRNSSLDALIPVLVEHNEELRRTGVNLNQVVHHLNTYKAPALKEEVLQLLLAVKESTELQEKTRVILQEINDKWLQE
jgi:hypothetical protein